MQRNISKIESSHPDIICPPGKSPGAQVKYCSLKCCLPYITYIYFLKHQSSDCLHWVKPEFWLQDPTWGDVWRQHQMCSPLQGIASLAPNIIHCVYLFTEEPFLSFSGGVLPKVWHRPPKVKLQGQRGRFSRSWKEKVWNHFHWCIPLQLCVSWYDSPLNTRTLTYSTFSPDSARKRAQTTSTWLQPNCLFRSSQTRKAMGRARSAPLPVLISLQPHQVADLG